MKEISRIATEHDMNVQLINLADNSLLAEKPSILSGLKEHLIQMGCPPQKLQNEIDKIVSTLDFPFAHPSVLQAKIG